MISDFRYIKKIKYFPSVRGKTLGTRLEMTLGLFSVFKRSRAVPRVLSPLTAMAGGTLLLEGGTSLLLLIISVYPWVNCSFLFL